MSLRSVLQEILPKSGFQVDPKYLMEPNYQVLSSLSGCRDLVKCAARNLPSFSFFFMKMRADEKYIKSHVSLPDITLPYLLTVYELHNFIPFCYLNTEQMKNVDPLFSKNQYGTKSWRGT